MMFYPADSEKECDPLLMFQLAPKESVHAALALYVAGSNVPKEVQAPQQGIKMFVCLKLILTDCLAQNQPMLRTKPSGGDYKAIAMWLLVLLLRYVHMQANWWRILRKHLSHSNLDMSNICQ